MTEGWRRARDSLDYDISRFPFGCEGVGDADRDDTAVIWELSCNAEVELLVNNLLSEKQGLSDVSPWELLSLILLASEAKKKLCSSD